jgi:3-hydroxymyristoyl/3-hydroxydecanoyl-(acyl carrier protein) dehydratase
MRDDELAFDGVPIEAYPTWDAERAPSAAPESGDAADGILAEAMRAHRVVLDVHRLVAERLLAAAGSIAGGSRAGVPQPVPAIPSPRTGPGHEPPALPTAPSAAVAIRTDPERPLIRPQLPVGDMRMVGSELTFEGTPGGYEVGSTLVSDFPVPDDPWYRSEDRSSLVNLAWQEIALQPAGRLAVRSGIAAELPGEDLVCRNLEGRARLLRHVSPCGRTLRVRSELIGHTPLHRAVMLRFAFTVDLDGEHCYEGETVHGFFTPDTLARQQGLDGGRRVQTWLERQNSPLRAVNAAPPSTGEHRLALIDDVSVVLDGGDHGSGYALARKQIEPDAWYFDGHFRGDPVMPGSLGVELLFQTLHAYGTAAGLTEKMRAPCFTPAPGAELSWKYRGQVLRDHDQIQAEVHLRAVEQRPDHLLLHADGSLYNDGLRIYQVDGLCLELREGRRP